MSERIITLFGEEIVPEQLKAVGRSRAKKKPEEKKEEVQPQAEKKDEPEQKVEAGVKAETEVIAETTAQQTETEQAPQEEIKEKKKVKAKEKAAELPDDWKGDKQYYSIGEVADLFKVKTSHIRFWTKEFKLKVRTTRKGDRLYTAEQIKELKAINHLVKERKFTLSGAKAKLQEDNNIDVATVDLKQQLLQLRNKLVAIKNQLK